MICERVPGLWLAALSLLGICGFVAGRSVERSAHVAEPAPSQAVVPVVPAEWFDDLNRPLADDEEANWLPRLLSGEIDSFAEDLAAMEKGERTRLSLRFIASMDVATMAALAETYFGAGTSHSLSDWREAVGKLPLIMFAKQWAEQDSKGFYDFVSRRLWAHASFDESWDNDDGTIARFAVISGIQAAPDLTIAFANGLPGKIGQSIQREVCSHLMATDPERGLALIAEIGGVLSIPRDMPAAAIERALPLILKMDDSKQRKEILEQVFDRWSEHDSEAAFAAWQSLPTEVASADGWSSLNFLLMRWSARDPDRAVEAFESLSEEQRFEKAGWVINGWWWDDPLAASKWGADRVRPRTLENLLSPPRSKIRPVDALNLMLELPEAKRNPLSRQLGSLFRNYLAEEPLAAMQWMHERKDDLGVEFQQDEELGRATGASLAMAGSEVLGQALEQLEAGSFRSGVIGSALEYVAYDDPGAAQALLADLEGNERTQALISMGVGWAEQDPVAANAYVLAQGDLEALNVTVARWSLKDPAAAHAWLMDSHGNDLGTRDALIANTGIGSNWVHRDPVAAAEAMLALPDLLASGPLSEVVGIWAGKDPLATSDFVNERFDPGLLRDQAVTALVQQIRHDDPESAAEWAASITDPELRSRALQDPE